MRKFMNIFAAALIMLAAVSCEKNEVLPDNNSEGKVVTLNASINNGGTKTSLGPGVQEESNPIQYPVYWSKNDAIAVIQQEDQQDGSVYIFTLSEGGAGKASATFECNNAYGFDPNLPYRAVYPASSVLTSNGKFCGYSFSATQSYVQNSFGVGAMPMQTNMYIGTNNPLNFSNVFGVLKLQLKGAADEKVTSIVVTSNDPLSGEAGLSGGKVVLKATAAKKVTLNCGANGVVLNSGTATDFHIALPAGDHELSVCFVTNKGVYYKTTEQTIESGRIIKMASLNTESKGEPSSDFPNGNMSYVENGVYLGEGVALPSETDSEGNPTKYLIWAPVNCRYDAQKNISADKYEGGYNPCPNGWKVPSKNDVATLNINNNAEILYSGGTPVGLKVFGNVSSTTENSKWISLPADKVSEKSVTSKYWTSTPTNLKYYDLTVNIPYSASIGWWYQFFTNPDGQYKDTKLYIRCVKR